MENNQQSFLDFFENAPIFFTFWDENLCLTNYNKATQSLFHAESKKDFIGKYVEEISPGATESGRIAVYQNVKETGTPARFRSFVLHPALGGKHIGAYIFKLGKGIAIIGMEVTDWVEEEKAIIVQLEQKNKELEQFAYVASHDLQEPLETVLSFTRLLKNKYENQLDEKANRYVEFVVQAAQRMQSLVRDVLEYARVGKQPGNELVNMNNLVKEVLGGLASLIEKSNTQIIVSDLPEIKTNANQCWIGIS